jgi:SAM-dependent methyltransferase
MNNIIRRIIAMLYGLRQWLLTQEWFTSRLLPSLPRSLRWALRKLFFLPFDLVEKVLGHREEMVPPKSAIFTGSVDDFKSSGQAQLHHFLDFAAITPDARVLDIGCGLGRLAVPLTSFLSSNGGYDGMDIVPSAIKWSTDNITARYPNFRFILADVYNGEYNPRGRVKAAEYMFPYEDETFDLVILNSVFTHMLPTETEHYVSEVSRILKRGGRCYASYSLIDTEAKTSMAAGQSMLHFKHHLPPYWTVGLEVPELAVAYDESFIRNLYQRYSIDGNYTIYYGNWVTRPSKAGTVLEWDQDIVVSAKK